MSETTGCDQMSVNAPADAMERDCAQRASRSRLGLRDV